MRWSELQVVGRAACLAAEEWPVSRGTETIQPLIERAA